MATLSTEDVISGARLVAKSFLSGSIASGMTVAHTPWLRSLGGASLVAAAGIVGGSVSAAVSVTGCCKSGMPNGRNDDPGDGMWLLVTEEGWNNIVFYQFDREEEARDASGRLTMPRVLYDRFRVEIASAGHPLGCNTIRTHSTPSTKAIILQHWMVVLENGPGNVDFYPFETEVQAKHLYNSLFDSKPRILIDPAGQEHDCGGWNPLALRTIRHRVAEANRSSVRHHADVPDQAKTCPCFLPNTAFKAPGDTLRLAKSIQEGDSVLVADGTTAFAVKVTHHPRQKYKLVELVTNRGSIKVSADHRIVLAVGDDSSATCRADQAQVGDKVLVGEWVRSLTRVTPSEEATELVEITFEPDGNVEAFLVPMWGMQTRGEPPAPRNCDPQLMLMISESRQGWQEWLDDGIV